MLVYVNRYQFVKCISAFVIRFCTFREVKMFWRCCQLNRKSLFFSALRNVFVWGEACWWTVHPATRQRSEGEKVRVGDDLILVSVSSERYLVSLWRLKLFFFFFLKLSWPRNSNVKQLTSLFIAWKHENTQIIKRLNVGNWMPALPPHWALENWETAIFVSLLWFPLSLCYLTEPGMMLDTSVCYNSYFHRNPRISQLILINLCVFHLFPQHLSYGTALENKKLSDSLMVNAAFHQTLWRVTPICSGFAQGKRYSGCPWPWNLI